MGQIDCVFCDLSKILILEENFFCVVIAPLDEYSPGHRIVILKNHREDIADSSLHGEELFSFIWTIHNQVKLMKELLGTERIYVCMLCDGVQHLHAHLIPRYRGDKTGFQFLAEQEIKYDAIRYPQEDNKQETFSHLLSW